MLLEGLCRHYSIPLILLMEIAIPRMFRHDMPAQVEKWCLIGLFGLQFGCSTLSLSRTKSRPQSPPEALQSEASQTESGAIQQIAYRSEKPLYEQHKDASDASLASPDASLPAPRPEPVALSRLGGEYSVRGHG